MHIETAAGTGPAIVGTGGFTVAAWIRTTVNANQVIIQQRSAQQYNGEYMLQVMSTGKLRFWTFGGFAYGAIVISEDVITDGQWHHVAGVREDNGTTRIYVDGSLSGSKTGSSRPLVPIKVYIGADMRGRSNFLDGLLDDVMIYDRSLSAEQIADLVNSQSAADALILVGRSTRSTSRRPPAFRRPSRVWAGLPHRHDCLIRTRF